ncbi:MAG: F0F1 ATP synthase subunit A [Clostridiales bacterium]|nr:F0F1 ATP synthase subunit A [Clostridiales bacterium]
MILAIKLGVSAIVFVACFFWRHAVMVKQTADASDANDKEIQKQYKKKKRLPFWGMVISGWFFVSTIISQISGGFGNVAIEFELFSPAQQFAWGGHTFGVAKTTVLLCIVTLVVLVLALLFRLFAVPRFKETPHGLQNLAEAAVEAMDQFTENTVGKKLAKNLSPYMMSLAVMMIGCACTELFGQRPPTADLLVTITMGLVTLFLINYYGIKEKGLGGRIRSMGGPVKVMSPLMFVLKIISDIATPVSLACRLFGNMIGGMIVMDLLKSALGGYGFAIPSVAGLWFNLFHPLIQTYIFIVLSLTFIKEAAE